MPSTGTVRPPRNGPIIRHFIAPYSAGSYCCATAKPEANATNSRRRKTRIITSLPNAEGYQPPQRQIFRVGDSFIAFERFIPSGVLCVSSRAVFCACHPEPPSVGGEGP